MTTIISGNTPSTIGNDTTISGDITADNLPANGSIVGYQQGAWTVASNAVIADSGGTWVRVGNRVTLFLRLGFGANSGSANCLISGLPYDFDLTLPDEIGRAVGYVGYTNNGSPLGFLGDGADDGAVLIRALTGSGAQLNLTAVNNLSVRGAIEYLTADTTWTPQNGATVS